ncbi:unnamed protein product [Acanthoscelides obtectus]|uniref:Uncharacterized protein n=1 Tax=Acanthoscelides obtectus TaxID=200917 RepID=A0A9P0LEJ5_ACAOB|nr:unnamed protein product [Acanthoscelides obtectus]CAK1624522.1 hypothetical protein AOBTE_LOCUS2585 [Acanthoscelides obtectus]
MYNNPKRLQCEALVSHILLLKLKPGGYTLTNYKIHPFSDKVVGFIAQHLRLTSDSVDSYGVQYKQSFFMKCLPQRMRLKGNTYCT